MSEKTDCWRKCFYDSLRYVYENKFRNGSDKNILTEADLVCHVWQELNNCNKIKFNFKTYLEVTWYKPDDKINYADLTILDPAQLNVEFVDDIAYLQNKGFFYNEDAIAAEFKYIRHDSNLNDLATKDLLKMKDLIEKINSNQTDQTQPPPMNIDKFHGIIVIGCKNNVFFERTLNFFTDRFSELSQEIKSKIDYYIFSPERFETLYLVEQ